MSKSAPFWIAALFCFIASAAVHRSPAGASFLKVKQYHFERDQEALRDLTLFEVDAVREMADTQGMDFEQARTAFLEGTRNPEQKRLAALPLEDYVVEVTEGRAISVTAPEWNAIFESLPVAGSDTESAFFRRDEIPFRSLSADFAAGKTRYLQSGMNYYEVYTIPRGEFSGKESGTHDFSRTWIAPDRLAYPYRKFSIPLALLGLVLIYIPRILRALGFLARRGVPGRPEFRNTQKTVVIVWMIIGLAALAFCFVPSAAGWDMMQYGFGTIMMSGFLVVICVIVVCVYAGRAARLERLFGGADLLAHWIYSPEEWRRFAELEYQTEKKEKRALYILVAVITAVIGAGFLIFADEGGFAVAAVLAGLLVLLAGVAFLVPQLNHRRNLRNPGEVLISPTAAYVTGAFHSWTMLGARMESINLVDGDPLTISIVYSAPSRQGRDSCALRIPVPKGKREDAERLVSALQQKQG